MAGINTSQLKALVVAPTLQLMGQSHASMAAVNLVVGTALAESNAAYLRQVTNTGYGPAMGLWQMEPFTHDDCWSNWLRYPGQSKAATAIRAMIGNLPATADLMVTNLAYACAMCRVKYYRAPAALPHFADAEGLSRYHKQFYNSALGAADPVANVAHFREAVQA
ncbi:hypothetical protein [Asaia astilbis]|uniref:hypothetical protein n=1 Tax=Asaia astilbis TaxID=610244 RepID=UPI00047264E8|nr:hypothetical protein [Asaia astilbis]